MKFTFKRSIQFVFFIFFVFVLSFFSASIMFASTFYIHELGHIIFGVIGNLVITGKFSSFEITNWINLPLLLPTPSQFSIIVPVSTRLDPNPESYWFALTGIGSVSAVLLILGFYFYKIAGNIEKKMIIILVGAEIIYQFVANFLCGTDNFWHSYFPIQNCQEVVELFQYVIPMLFFIFCLIFFSYRLREGILSNSK